MGDKIDHFVRGLKPKVCERVVVDPFNECGRWDDFKQWVTYAVALDATIEQLCPKEMRKIPLNLVVLSARTRHVPRP